MISHGVTGLLCKTADPEAFADALEQIANDPELAIRMGEAGRQIVEKNFSWENAGISLKKAIKSITMES